MQHQGPKGSAYYFVKPTFGNNPNRSFTYEHPDNGETTVVGLNYFDMKGLFLNSVDRNGLTAEERIDNRFKCTSYELTIENPNGVLEDFPKIFTAPFGGAENEFYNLVKGEYVNNFQESGNYKFTLTATFRDKGESTNIFLDPETGEPKELQITQFFPTQTNRNTYVEINIIPIYQSLFDYNVLFLDNNTSNLLFLELYLKLGETVTH